MTKGALKMIEILDWSGTIFVLIAAFIIGGKKASIPKVRLIGLVFFLTANALWVPMAIILQTWGLLMSQVILVLINLRGIINCIKEMKTC